MHCKGIRKKEKQEQEQEQEQEYSFSELSLEIKKHIAELAKLNSSLTKRDS